MVFRTWNFPTQRGISWQICSYERCKIIEGKKKIFVVIHYQVIIIEAEISANQYARKVNIRV